jgi:prepilin-type N-terminal cleavage/methylation domain-containing protein
MKFPMTNFELRSLRPLAGEGESDPIRNSQFAIRNSSGFSLIEVMVAVALMSLIVIALMAVFSSTQKAFRASVTQTDVLEGGRAAMELITQDLRQMTPSGGISNFSFGAVNFSSLDNDNPYPYAVPSLAYSPLQQNLPGSGALRINFLNYFFLLGRENTKWIGIGYAVGSTNTTQLYPLYRFYAETNLATPPRALFDNFRNAVFYGQWTNMSHVMDGVVHFAVRPNDARGYPMTNTYQFNSGQWVTNRNVWFYPPVQVQGEVGFYFFSNTVPASVELELGVLEDQPLQHAGSLPTPVLRTQYLQQQSGRVHLFRQLVTIPNVDPTAYQ